MLIDLEPNSGTFLHFAQICDVHNVCFLGIKDGGSPDLSSLVDVAVLRLMGSRGFAVSALTNSSTPFGAVSSRCLAKPRLTFWVLVRGSSLDCSGSDCYTVERSFEDPRSLPFALFAIRHSEVDDSKASYIPPSNTISPLSL